MKKLFIVTNYKNIFPQKTHETNSLDLKIITKELQSNGITTIIQNLDYIANMLLSNKIIVDGNYFFFCSSQIEDYKNTIIDIAYEVQERGGILIPKLDFYMSHENKYFQELYKKRCHIKTPPSAILSNSETVDFIDITLPCVVKKHSGFGSRGVTLVKNKSELNKSVYQKMNLYWVLNNDIYESIKRLFKTKIKFKNLYPKKFGRVILQELIPNLAYDWKVLVFNDYIFALKRYNRKNDFKASGSGLFDFNAIPSKKLIQFAFECRKKLDTPFISLDIAEQKDNSFNIIEYQAVHFGLSTALNCHRYYHYNNNEIDIIEKNINSIEYFFAYSIIEYINNNYFVGKNNDC
ncbi:TPA: hypothetical protein ACKRDV_001686 [Proteus mirabilis]